MQKDIGIGVIGLGMGQDLFYVNSDPSTRFEVRGICATTSSKTDTQQPAQYILSQCEKNFQNGNLPFICA